jgi:hypothetical protein
MGVLTSYMMDESLPQPQDATPSDHDRQEPSLTGENRQRPSLSSGRREEHNLTSREAMQLFEALGVPRNQRSIERYCDEGKMDCFKDPDERRYYISRASAERLIGHFKELKARHQRVIDPVGAAVPPDAMWPAEALPRPARDDAPAPADPARMQDLEHKLAALEREKKTLEEANFTLSYEKKASEQMVTMMREQIKEDRKDFFGQIDKLVKDVGDTKQLVGELQTQLKQIEAPKPASRPTTMGARQITEAEVLDANAPTTAPDTPPTPLRDEWTTAPEHSSDQRT